MDGREKDPLTVATPIPLLSHQPGAERVQADIGTTAAHASVQPGTTIPTFSAEEKQALLGIARRVLEQVVADLIPPQLQVNHFSANLAQRRACFVTLTRGGELRGCIGQLTTEKPLYMPKSLLGQAIDYTLARWEALTRYVDDGRLEIDNNLCENAIRPTAVGKKNFLFIGHPEAGQRSAVIYSVLGSCRRHGINPGRISPGRF